MKRLIILVLLTVACSKPTVIPPDPNHAKRAAHPVAVGATCQEVIDAWGAPTFVSTAQQIVRNQTGQVSFWDWRYYYQHENQTWTLSDQLEISDGHVVEVSIYDGSCMTRTSAEGRVISGECSETQILANCATKSK